MSFFNQKFLRSHKLSLSFFEKKPSIINFRIKIITPTINLTYYILNNNPLLCVKVGCQITIFMTWLILVGRVGFRFLKSVFLLGFRGFFFGVSHKGVLQITVNGFRV